MSYPGLAPGETDLRAIVQRINSLLAGKMNAVTTVTLTANDTTTTLTDSRIGGGTYIGLQPVTATATAAMVYVSAKAKGSATLTHDNTIDTDRTFDVLLIG
jgi:hypothetical protein